MTFYKTENGKEIPLKEEDLIVYKMICRIIWGSVPYDYTWATGTKLYQDRLKRYYENNVLHGRKPIVIID